MSLSQPTANKNTDLSLLAAFHPIPRPHRPSHRTVSPSPSSTVTTPSSSPRPSGRRSLTSSPSHSYRSTIRSRLFSSSPSTTRFCLRRRPSAVDLALEQEKHSSSYIEHLGLDLLEPRPVERVPVRDGRALSSSTHSRLSWSSAAGSSYMSDEERDLRCRVIGSDSPIDGFEDFNSLERLSMPPISLDASSPLGIFGAAAVDEDASFVMGSIAEVMESGSRK